MIDEEASGDNNGVTHKSEEPNTKKSKGNTEPLAKNVSSKSRTLFIIGDSHVRHLKDLVKHTMFDDTKIVDRFQGGASLLQICNYLKQSVSAEDHIFVFGGTNDINRNSLSSLQPDLLKLLTRYPRVKLTFILVPLRVHWNREYYQNDAILKFNQDLMRVLRKMDHHCLNFLDTNQILHAGHYSRDGIHLNMEGKKAVSTAIAYMFHEHCTKA